MQNINWLAYFFAAAFLAAIFGTVYGLGLPPAHPDSSPAVTIPKAAPPAASDQIGPQFLGKASFQRWTLTCAKGTLPAEAGAGEGIPTRQCRIWQAVGSSAVGGGLAGEVNVLRQAVAEDFTNVLFVRLPPESRGAVLFWVDENQRFRKDVDRCTPVECIVQMGVSNDFIRSMQEGFVLNFQVKTPNRMVSFSAPLDGFDQAFAAMMQASP
ncbi:MAG: invasion associated locus B family protein [Alphaproteobacteria bacterium]|nr:invasion associated locus B family protein [Alphaproteobacteria bacterium]